MYKLMFYTLNDLFLTDSGMLFPFMDPNQEPPPINPIVPTIAAIAVIAAALPIIQEMIVPPSTTAILTTTTVATATNVATTTTVTTTTGIHLVCLCQANSEPSLLSNQVASLYQRLLGKRLFSDERLKPTK